jgi:anti-anti-sigma factor
MPSSGSPATSTWPPLDASGKRRRKPATRARTIVIDASSLDFIDSSGLHQLVQALKRQREVGGDLVLHRPTAQTMRVLEIVGLDKVLTITS